MGTRMKLAALAVAVVSMAGVLAGCQLNVKPNGACAPEGSWGVRRGSTYQCRGGTWKWAMTNQQAASALQKLRTATAAPPAAPSTTTRPGTVPPGTVPPTTAPPTTAPPTTAPAVRKDPASLAGRCFDPVRADGVDFEIVQVVPGEFRPATYDSQDGSCVGGRFVSNVVVVGGLDVADATARCLADIGPGWAGSAVLDGENYNDPALAGIYFCIPA